jgi:hypothetical protein
MENEIRSFAGEEGEEVPLTLLEVSVWSHGRISHLHGAVEGLLVKAGGFVHNAADDRWVNGGTAPPASTIAPTMGV